MMKCHVEYQTWVPQKIYLQQICSIMCMKRYSHKYTEYLKPDINIRNHKSSIVVKQSRFLQAMENIDPLLQKGYGFTVSDIKDSMIEGDKLDFTIYNRDVKQLLTDHYGDRIRFAPNTRKNESELVFSSHITASELAVKIKNFDVIGQAAAVLRKSAKQVSYDLDDRFCDAQDIEKAWQQTALPDEWLTFFGILYNIPKSVMAKLDHVSMLLEEFENDVDEEDEETNEKWVHKNKHSQLNCQFQMIYYHTHHGRKKTPLHTLLGQSAYGKTRSREIITTLNRIGVSTSYTEVKRSRNLMAAYTVHASQANEVPIPGVWRL